MWKRIGAGLILLQGAWACCSVAPAHFSQTRGLAAEVQVKGKRVHLLGYQNTAKNRSASGGNAMLLPIPARAGSMGQKNILDTSSCPHMLRDMEKALEPPKNRSGTRAMSPNSSQVQIFDHDIYTIVLAQDATAIPAALKLVKPERRPLLGKEIFQAYGRWYKGWTFALCCFNNREASAAKPMVWWYEPLDSQTLFFPALDAHDGHPPDLNAQVPVDHTVMVSAEGMGGWHVKRVHYTDNPSASLRPYLPKTVIGNQFHGTMPNGDFVFKVEDVRQGIFKPRRALPPGA